MSNNNYCKDCIWVCGKNIILGRLSTLRCKNFKNNGWWIEPDISSSIDKVTGRVEKEKGTYQLCTTARRDYNEEGCMEDGKFFERQNSLWDKIKPFNSWFIIMEILLIIEMLAILISIIF
jgi:hypothetical protein